MSFLKKYWQKKDNFTEKIYTKSDYDDTFKDVRTIFKYIGIRISQKDSPSARFWYDTYYWVQFVSLIFALFCEVSYVLVIAQGASFEDVLTIFSTIPCISYMILAKLKSYKMVVYRPIYENLIDEIRAMWPDDKVSTEELPIVSQALKELKFIVKPYIASNYLLNLSYFVTNYIYLIRRAFGHEIPRHLPFHFWLYIDLEQPKVYEFFLLLQNWQTCLTLWFNLCGDLLFCIFLCHITTQMDLLGLRIKKMFPLPIDNQLIAEYPLAQNNLADKKTGTFHDNEEKYHQELRAIAKRHAALIRLSGDVEEIFSFALFINFLFTSIIICFCGFCCVLVEKWNETAYKLFLITGLAQTGLMCRYGQKLVDSSTGIAESIYSSGWYTTSKKIKSTILIMLHRSQKEVRVTTYGFSTICLASYSTIIKSAWSYFTILMKTYKK